MASNVSKAHIVLTMNGAQAQKVLEALKHQAENLATQMKSMQDAGQGDTTEYRVMEKELKAVQRAVRENVKEYINLDDIIQNLAGNTRGMLAAALKSVAKEMNNLTGNDSAKLEKLKSQYEQINAQIKKLEVGYVDVGKVLNNVKAAPIDDLKRAASQLEKEIGKTTRNTEEYVKKSAEYSRIKREIDEVNNGWEKQDSTIASVGKRLAAYVGIYGAFNMIKNKLTEVVKKNIEFSDSLADIRKTTGLSAADVNRLSDSINTIDTRTSREELHALAFEAGRLGIGQYGAEGILGFVRASNQLSVALKEDLGQDAIVQLVKMADVMGDVKKLGVEKSLMAIGSAINELAQSSTARGDYMTNYSRRLSGIAVQAHLTTAEIIGLAGAADSTGQEVEVAATAMNKFVVQLQTHYKTVAAAAGISADALHGLLEQGKTADAIVMVLRALGDKGGLSVLAPLMKDMGSDGARLTASLATLATNVDKVESSINLARDAFDEATSVTNEYNIKNENAAAIMERMKNSWDKMFVNQANVGVIRDMVKDFADMSESLQKNELLIAQVKVALFLLMNAIKGIVQLLPYLTIFLSAKGWLMLATTIRMNLIPAFTGMVSSLKTVSRGFASAAVGATGATRAFKVLGAVFKSNIFVGVASVLFTVVASLVSLRKQMDDVAVSAKNLKTSIKDYTRTSSAAAAEANHLFSRLKSATAGTKEHRDIMRAINSQYSTYLPFLISEKTSLEDIETAQRKVNDELRKSLALKAQNSAIDEVGTQYSNKMADNLGSIQELYNRNVGRAAGEVDINKITELTAKYKDAGMTYIQVKEKVWADMYKAGPQGQKGGVSHALVKSGGALSNEWKTLQEQMNAYIANYWNQQEAIKKIQEKYKPLIGDYTEPTETLDSFVIEENDKEGKEAKWRREQLRKAKSEYQAVMSAIEVFYKQQEQVVNQAYLDRKITTEQREKELTAIQNKHLETRIQARKKLHGDKDNLWNEELESLPLFDIAKTDNSMKAVENLVGKNLELIGNNLRKFGEKEDDGIWKNLEDDILKMQKISIDQLAEVEKILLKYDFTGQVTRQFQAQLEKLRIFFVDYADATEKGYADAQKAAEGGMRKLLNISSGLYDIDINSAEGLGFFKDIIAGSEEFGTQMLNMTDNEYRTLYYKTIEYGDAITEAEKRANDRSLKIAKERWQRTQQYKDDALQGEKDKDTLGVYKAYESVGLASPSMVQDQETLMYMNRLEAAKRFYDYLESQGRPTEEAMLAVQEAASDLSQKLVESTKERLSRLKEYGDAMETFGSAFGESVFVRGEEGLDARKKAMEDFVRSVGEATKNMILDWVKQQIEHQIIRTAMSRREEEFQEDMTGTDNKEGKNQTKSIQKAGRDVLKETVKWGKSKLKAKKNEKKEEEQVEKESQDIQGTIATEGTAAVADAVIGIGEAAVGAKKTQAAENVSTSAAETSAEVPLGIASGAAQTIGQLGWWGIPLIAVITALLNGLLSSAMGKVGSLFGGGGSGAAAVTKTKLVSGMLTYDSGNVQAFGNDGHMYSATPLDHLSTGMVSSPVATTVNGQPALVGERGPEMVIGRETTAAMMMSRPDLLNAIIQFDKNRSGKTYRAYDAGNVQEVGLAGGNGSGSSLQDAVGSVIEERFAPMLQAMAGVIEANTKTNNALNRQLETGINAKITKGSMMKEVVNGLYETKKQKSDPMINKLFGK